MNNGEGAQTVVKRAGTKVECAQTRLNERGKNVYGQVRTRASRYEGAQEGMSECEEVQAQASTSLSRYECGWV